MEIKTNSKNQTIEISVPAQMEPLLEIANITIEQLIQSYLFDLGKVLHGSNGFDERNMAEGYFRRSWHGYGDRRTDIVFGMFTHIRNCWDDYGMDRADDFAEFEKDKIKELMQILADTNQDEIF